MALVLFRHDKTWTGGCFIADQQINEPVEIISSQVMVDGQTQKVKNGPREAKLEL